MNKTRVPKASPEPLPELATFLEPFAPLFRRHTSRDSMERYLTGLLSDLPHKTCDTIADVIAGTSVERLQHLLTDAAWDPLELDEARVKRLLSLHPVTDGILVFDDTGLPKKGAASVGVAAQYSGTLGKIGNCQVVVSAEYLADDPASSTPFHFPISAQLFLPESWTDDAERRKQAQVPEEICQQTKPEIALGLLDRARRWGVPIQAVVVDAGYGDNPNFLQGLDDRQVPYVCAVQSTFGCRLPDEVAATAAQTPVYGGRGQPRKPRPAPLYTVKEQIAALPASAWQTVAWREGTKGTMQIQAVAIRVHWATGSTLHSTSHSRVHTGPEGWLLAERPVPEAVAADPQPTQAAPQEKEEEKIKYWFSVLPEDTSLQRLILLAHARLQSSSSFTKMPNRNAASTTIRDGAGMVCIDTWRWSCWPTVSSCFPVSRCLCLLERLFPPCVTRSSLPSVHRQVLLWLFQDLVLWLLHTQQIESFRPRRN